MKKPNYYEPDLNPSYQELAEHYKVAVLPARLRKRKDKANVENGVQNVERWLLAPLRNRIFFSVGEANRAMAALLETLNAKEMQHLGKSRRELFKELDQPALLPLPERPYEFARWKNARVSIDYHIAFKGHITAFRIRWLDRSADPGHRTDAGSLSQESTSGDPSVEFTPRAILHLGRPHAIPPPLSPAFCDEVVVVDAGSRDATRELAARAGARVVDAAPWPGFVAQRKRAVAEARHDWVLALDADERVTPALGAEIRALVAETPAAAGYRVPRVVFYLGRWIRGTDWYPDLQLRLFDRRRGRYEGGLVHESWRCEGEIGRLRGELEHHPYRDVADHLRRIDRYTSLWADEARAAGRRTGLELSRLRQLVVVLSIA